MSKTKPNINSKKFSWENLNKKKICEYEKCIKIADYKAPKSRNDLNNYYFFCLDHVKIYNKSWDFYKGLSVNEIEKAVRDDIIWQRPTWPLQKNSVRALNEVRDLLNDQYNPAKIEAKFQNYLKNKIIDQELTEIEQKSLEILEITIPLDLIKIKKAYKKLVKIFHPDVNKGNKNAEERFKEINQAYKILLKKFLAKT